MFLTLDLGIHLMALTVLLSFILPAKTRPYAPEPSSYWKKVRYLLLEGIVIFDFARARLDEPLLFD